MRVEDQAKFEEFCANKEYQHVEPNLLLKKVLRPAEQGEKCPSWDTKVIVHYHGTMLDGKVFDSSVTRNTPFEFNVGQGAVIKGWDKGVPTMNVGEKALFILHPDVAYGESGSGSIPGGACLQFEIELLDFVESDHEYPASPEERVAAARVRQEQAKKLFAQEKFARANQKYEKGTQLLESIQSDSLDLKMEAKKLRATLFANMCLCYQKMNEFKKSVKSGEDALKECDDEDLKTKIYSRMVKSWVSEGNLLEAIRIGQEGLEQTGNNQMVAKELQKAKEKQMIEEKRRKDLYAKMMGNSFRAGSEGAAGASKPGDKEGI